MKSKRPAAPVSLKRVRALPLGATHRGAGAPGGQRGLPMRLAFAARVIGLMLLLFSVSLVVPLGIAMAYDDGLAGLFLEELLAATGLGLLLWAPLARRRLQTRATDGFLIVTLMWVAMSFLGAVPFIFGIHLDLAAAVFEAASAFTTTGATVIVGLDALPPSILFYRQELQWIGGIGVVVLAVALLPVLGVGGMQLFKAETPGPMKDEKLTPRISHTARILFKLYLALTMACALAYWVAGMSAFDAVAHSLTTLSTGGFSTHDAGIAHFDSPAIEAVAIVFMLLGAINFAVHFTAWQRLDLRQYWRNVEVRVFLLVVALLVAVCTLTLYATGYAADPLRALRLALFEVVTVITSTGFGIDDFSVWPLALPVLLMFSTFMGACAGSTAGGMKTIRFIILVRQALIEVHRLIHPSLVRPLKIEGRVMPQRVVEAVWGFFVVYIIVFAITMLAVMFDGLDQVTAFGAVATCINNVGPGLGKVSANFTAVSDLSKWFFAFAMIMGRLEIFTIFVLLTPAFWRR